MPSAAPPLMCSANPSVNAIAPLPIARQRAMPCLKPINCRIAQLPLPNASNNDPNIEAAALGSWHRSGITAGAPGMGIHPIPNPGGTQFKQRPIMHTNAKSKAIPKAVGR
eukprot:CAMPEP_0202873764 /NCGR_PEP_ID=MMETSP1391-20130828/23966_1 /ASSEMBLY_ACC=CAM_ASM_000867 /TAXON_ID=1034604 /ORGANISM="Chlamydomonas leiostraca, Strain SAG 11-49" /LENGTH=109 /DNA_ID=CAMNT_0049555047 /DNA_START=336 /DNA_END=665 /DNA_ORIENTATION=-